MTLRECYRILQVGNGASLDEVKKAYRKLAFELHPDLNPGRPDAARRFQRLNEAYVLLSRTLDTAGPGGNGNGTGAAGGAAERESAEREATRAYEQARQRFGDMGTGGPGGVGGTGGGNGPSASSSSGTGGTGGTGATGASSATGAPGATASGGASATRGASGADRNRRRAEATYQGRQDEVLQDILRDPFARRVFEDIYSQIRRDGGGGLAARPPKKRKLSLEWGGKALTLDLTHGIGGAVKGWLRRQIDDEQTVYLPALSIVPGARLRLQVTQGLSGEVRTVEVTLPPDYVVGRPIRLKGLGKRIGPWQGDLYLRILAKTA
ncbi:J domain-containing protein [Nitratidesulfovibrio liaohensis]|uniref:J domain-containing protein n=1 Tax=Nitratidesulfovibrio liaohensis TaxID=2604158 RepID=A0ABY9R0T5_9BACT|nr:J domain-containing protein [Nitratidesulfovibrio liaohensis]WMW65366.1 J domain-containing protein [Nitratidesulfovibrio liaohensis]